MKNVALYGVASATIITGALAVLAATSMGTTSYGLLTLGLLTIIGGGLIVLKD